MMRSNVKRKNLECRSSKMNFSSKKYNKDRIRSKYKYIMIIPSKLSKIKSKSIDRQLTNNNTSIESKD